MAGQDTRWRWPRSGSDRPGGGSPEGEPGLNEADYSTCLRKRRIARVRITPQLTPKPKTWWRRS